MSQSDVPLHRLPYLSDWVLCFCIWAAVLVIRCWTTPTDTITYLLYALFTPTILTGNVLMIRVYRNAWLRHRRR